MKLIELIDDKNSRTVDIVDSTYDFAVGMDLNKSYVLDNYDVFHNYFIEQVDVINDLGDKVVVDVSSFVNNNKAIFDKLFPNLNLESQVELVYQMKIGNCTLGIYDLFAKNIDDKSNKDMER